VRRGLAPIVALRTRVARLRDGAASRIDGAFPSEVAPLVDDLNALLAHRERAVSRAVAKAGDLAHGLKTPLALLSQDADRAEAAGQPELAASIRQQADRMRRQIDYHLAHARAAPSGATPGAVCAVDASAQALARTLAPLHAERAVAIEVACDAGHTFRGEREDLDEMLGNLMDNACKWARSRARVSSASGDTTVAITVDDDGRSGAAARRARGRKRARHRPRARHRARSRRAVRRLDCARAVAARRRARDADAAVELTDRNRRYPRMICRSISNRPGACASICASAISSRRRRPAAAAADGRAGIVERRRVVGSRARARRLRVRVVDCPDNLEGPMADEKQDVSRREFVTTVAAGLAAAAAAGGASAAELPVVEQHVQVKTADGVADAVFIHPSSGSHPGEIGRAHV